MAWQLIYTSAPRLLEAGRTGFGTVARHRAVSGMLAAAVERFSQFARLPGHDPRRIVHTCRMLTVGSGTYHVLSCLQDAGSDYTGRTNHIAHHLIAEPREIRALAAAGLTPADVLKGMAWRTSWSEGPRYLDSAEEIDLSSFAARPSHAWSAITGNPASAGILWSREVLKGCYLIAPDGVNVLELFRESLLVVPAQAWQTRFTTCLEPNDDLADFRWVGLPASSPMRVQVETSNRLVLDLTRPSSLPAPPELDAPAAANEDPAPAAPPPPPPQVHAAVPEKAPLPSAGHAPVATMGGWSPETRQRASKPNRSYIGLSLVIAAVLIVAVSGGLLWQFQQQQQQNQARSAYESDIAKLWKENDLLLDETKKFLEDQPLLEEGKALLKSHEEFFRSMKQVLNHPAKQTPLTQLTENKDDLTSLKKLLEAWAALHKNPWVSLQNEKEKATAASIDESFRKWERLRKDIWKNLKEFLDLKAVPLPSDELLQPLKAVAKEALKSKEPERGSRDNWKELFTLPDQKGQMDLQVERWLTLWEGLDSNSHTVAQEASADTSLPAWLHKKATEVKERHDKGHAPQMTAKAVDQDKKDKKEPVVTIDNADAVSALNPLYILLLKPGEDPTNKVTGLKVAADMRLYVGSAWDAHLSPDGKTEPKDGELKQWLSVSIDGKDEINFGLTRLAKLEEMIRISSTGGLLALPEQYRSASSGLRLVARSKDAVHVLFDLRLIPLSSVVAKPIFTQVIPATADNESTATLCLPEGFIPRLHLLSLANLVYSLRLEGTATEQKFYELKPPVDSSFEVMPPQAKMSLGPSLQQLRAKIAELEAGIKKDDLDLAKIDPKLPAHIQEQNKATYTKSKSNKEVELQTLTAQLQGLEGQKPVHFDLMPGHYTLMLEQPTKIEICKLNVTPAAKTPTPKPSNP